MKRLIKASTLLILVLLIAGCRPASAPTLTSPPPPTVTPRPTFTQRATPTSTVTPTTNPSPTPEPTPIPTPGVPPTRVPLEATRLNQDIFFGESAVANCELPCWNGLTVGQSGEDDIEAFFKNVIGLDEPPRAVEISPSDILDLPDTYSRRTYEWMPLYDSEDEEGGDFGLTLYYYRSPATLAGIRINSMYGPFDRGMTPQRVLRELGTPSDIHMSVSDPERSIDGFTSLYILYSEGYIFRYLTYITFNLVDGGVQFCLDDYHWNNDYDLYTVSAYIVEPFTEIPPFIQAFYHGGFTFEESNTMSAIFGVSLEEVTDMVTENDWACFVYSPVEN